MRGRRRGDEGEARKVVRRGYVVCVCGGEWVNPPFTAVRKSYREQRGLGSSGGQNDNANR
jgi:hypothetical protein